MARRLPGWGSNWCDGALFACKKGYSTPIWPLMHQEWCMCKARRRSPPPLSNLGHRHQPSNTGVCRQVPVCMHTWHMCACAVFTRYCWWMTEPQNCGLWVRSTQSPQFWGSVIHQQVMKTQKSVSEDPAQAQNPQTHFSRVSWQWESD